ESCSVTNLRSKLSSSTTRMRVFRLMLFRRATRDPQSKLTSFSWFALHGDAAANRFSQRRANRQTKSVAFAWPFSAEKRIENSCEHVRCDSLAGVRNFDDDADAFAFR